MCFAVDVHPSWMTGLKGARRLGLSGSTPALRSHHGVRPPVAAMGGGWPSAPAQRVAAAGLGVHSRSCFSSALAGTTILLHHRGQGHLRRLAALAHLRVLAGQVRVVADGADRRHVQHAAGRRKSTPPEEKNRTATPTRTHPARHRRPPGPLDLIPNGVRCQSPGRRCVALMDRREGREKTWREGRRGTPFFSVSKWLREFFLPKPPPFVR